MKTTIYISDNLADFYYLLDKIFSLNNDLNCNNLILTQSLLIDKVDKEIWTFSQNCFIPHITFDYSNSEELKKKFNEVEFDFFLKNNPFIIADLNVIEKDFCKNYESIFFILNLKDFSNCKKIIEEKDFLKNHELVFFFFEEFNILEKRKSFKDFTVIHVEISKEIRFFIKKNNKWIRETFDSLALS